MAKRKPVRIKNWRQLRRARRKLRKEVSKREELMVLRSENLLGNLKPGELGKSFARKFFKPNRLLALLPGLFQKRKSRKSRSLKANEASPGEDEHATAASGKQKRKTSGSPKWPVIAAGALAGVLLTNYGVNQLRDLFNGNESNED